MIKAMDFSATETSLRKIFALYYSKSLTCKLKLKPLHLLIQIWLSRNSWISIPSASGLKTVLLILSSPEFKVLILYR